MRETTRNCFQVVPARSAESGHEKCDGKMTKHGIRINTLLARLFPVYGSRLRKEIGYVHGDEIYFASKYTYAYHTANRNRDTFCKAAITKRKCSLLR